MSPLEAALLGVVQGLTEFLPVSSSGHLVLAERLLGIDAEPDVSFEVVVHGGTLLAVMLVLRRELLALAAATARCASPARWARGWREDLDFRQAVLVGLATVPAAVVGLAFEDAIEQVFAEPGIVPWMFLVTAAVLLSTLWPRTTTRPIDMTIAAAMGFAQAVAILPGISRSGSTIAAGLSTGADRRAAGRFSFLMAVPVITGACILKLDDIAAGAVSGPALLAGFCTACVSGVGALVLLLRLLERGRFWIFAPYLLAAAIWGFLIL